uniref:Slc18a-2 n=1 Tax=Schmidtea mediterranea TaxID=79327 RepID=A0A0H3YFB7_SCHMD|nr:slc18a-2 [Schmidtea mediterranea]
MMKLSLNQKLFLTVIEAFSVFLTVFLSQMITTVFPAYSSVKTEIENVSIASTNCSNDNPSNVYVSILIGSKYGTELIMFPIVGWITDRSHPPQILFTGALIEAFACVVYCISDNFYSSILARIIDAIGYSIVSTSGLTIIYTIYVNERSRNKVITFDSILVYIAGSTSPIIAGAIFESASKINKDSARIFTFVWLCPLFIILAVAISPFAFRNSYMSRYFGISVVKKKSVECKKFQNGKNELDINNSLLVKENDGNNINSTLQQDCSESIPSSGSKNADQFIDHKMVPNKMSSSLSLPDVDVIDISQTKSKNHLEMKKQLSAAKLLKDPHVMVVLTVLMFNSLIGNSLETTLPIFMIKKFCSDQTQQGAVWLFGFFSLIGFFLSSMLFHLKTSVCWILPMVGIVINGAICICIFFSKPWWVIGVCLGFMFFFSSMTECILIPVVPKIIDIKYSKSYGSASGLTLLTFTISGLIGTFPIGPLVEYFGFLTLCILLCCFTCLLSPFMACLRKYFK